MIKIGNALRHLLVGVALALVAAMPLSGDAQPTGSAAPSITEQTLYSFCVQSNCADGSMPYAGLFMDAAGNLYGTTEQGGSSNHGAVFKLTPTGGGWTETVLYSFCSQTGCTDGDFPHDHLVMDGSGNLYSTTTLGGAYGNGVVFQLTPAGSGWTEKVLYSFCSQAYCTDGSDPKHGLLMDAAGNLYGTANKGGNPTYNSGVVFQLTPNQGGWSYTVLHTFCSQTLCADGSDPDSALSMDGAGSIYGTATSGGRQVNSVGMGVVFQLTPNQNRTAWTETVLYSFCAQTNCADGANPKGGLVIDGAGNLYGTTDAGGNYSNDPYGSGVVFRLAPNQGTWSYTVLYTFCSQTNCVDGAISDASLIMDQSGNLYGTTIHGGNNAGLCNFGPASGCGVVFQLTPNQAGWSYGVLYKFCSLSNCADGAAPLGAVFRDGAGSLYGTTAVGGASMGGVVFALSTGNYALSVSVIGSPGGKVRSSPAGIDCGSTCSANFAAGTQIILSASPSAAWGLAGWGARAAVSPEPAL